MVRYKVAAAKEGFQQCVAGLNKDDDLTFFFFVFLIADLLHQLVNADAEELFKYMHCFSRLGICMYDMQFDIKFCLCDFASIFTYCLCITIL